MLLTKEFDYKLPKNLIAQKPVKPRDSSRLMIIDKQTKKITNDKFLNLPFYLKRGDVLVLNNSKVIPARLFGRKKTGGKVKVLLLKQINLNTWQCLINNLPVKKQVNTKINFPQNLKGVIIKREKEVTQIKFNLSGQKLMDKIFKVGKTPTPPYIKRIAREKEYQTFFAHPKKLGSVAAPTAGLHFTPKLFKNLKQKGIQIEFVTLHVGLGTFQPIKTKDVKKHKIHEEYFELNKQTAERLKWAKRKKRRIIAVGTTSARVLETCSSTSNLKPKKGFTRIYIYPGYEFKFIDAMITNFHLPKSSLILLVSAFAGKKLIKKAYREAVKKKYHFYSFGDAMLIK